MSRVRSAAAAATVRTGSTLTTRAIVRKRFSDGPHRFDADDARDRAQEVRDGSEARFIGVDAADGTAPGGERQLDDPAFHDDASEPEVLRRRHPVHTTRSQFDIGLGGAEVR
jgi:hypothetical protein